MRSLSLDEVKDAELQLLGWLTDFLDSHQLTYSLYGGTLLGAVRHHGFIPWDDDVDICMPRGDYETLLNYVDEFPDRIGVLSSRSGSGHHYPFTKIQDKRFLTSQPFAEDECPQHLCVDVFPIDGVPESKAVHEKLVKKLALIKRIINAIWANPADEGSGIKKIGRIALNHLREGRVERLLRSKRDSLIAADSFDDSRYVSCLAAGCRKPWRVPREEFIETVSVEFEGVTFRAMSCMDTFLSAVYGDYMELPPENQRVNHGLEAWEA